MLQNGIEERPRLPRAPRENFVIGGPIFLGIALKTDGTGDRAFAHPTENAKGQREGAFQAAFLGKDKDPEAGVFDQEVQEVHGEVSNF